MKFHYITMFLGLAVAAFMRLCAYADRELVGSVESPTQQKRCFSDHTMPKTYAAGTGTLAQLTPMAINSTTKKWVVWANAGGGTNQVDTITVDATGGNITISVTAPGGTLATTGNISATASAATMLAALLALADILPGDVAVTGGPGNAGGTTPYVLTWGGQYAGKALTVSTTAVSLTGGAGTVGTVHTTAAVASLNTNRIKGFVWPDLVTLDVSNDVLGQTCLGGDIHFDDIVLPTGETLTNLKIACRTLRALGFRIQGLDQVE